MDRQVDREEVQVARYIQHIMRREQSGRGRGFRQGARYNNYSKIRIIYDSGKSLTGDGSVTAR